MSTFILIHGAWHDARIWDRVAPALRSAGHTVVTPNLPGNGFEPPADATPAAAVTLARYADAIAPSIEGADAPVVLVGHSMAGIVVSALAERLPERLAKIVYIAAFMLPDGYSIVSFYERCATPGMMGARQALRLSADQTFSTIDPDAARALFFNRCTDADATMAAGHLGPQPAQPRRDPVHVTEERFGRVPRVYFSTLQDRTLFPALQRRMYAELVPTRVVKFDTDHSPFFSATDALVDALLCEAV
ncbi:MAG: alpha/beta fold hydrolase [Proteobacteria bacterium]|nr:alpha/beta fold hydrolase [Burkholderiales bacterium]